jgi:hypothetical protein
VQGTEFVFEPQPDENVTNMYNDMNAGLFVTKFRSLDVPISKFAAVERMMERRGYQFQLIPSTNVAYAITIRKPGIYVFWDVRGSVQAPQTRIIAAPPVLAAPPISAAAPPTAVANLWNIVQTRNKELSDVICSLRTECGVSLNALEHHLQHAHPSCEEMVSVCLGNPFNSDVAMWQLALFIHTAEYISVKRGKTIKLYVHSSAPNQVELTFFERRLIKVLWDHQVRTRLGPVALASMPSCPADKLREYLFGPRQSLPKIVIAGYSIPAGSDVKTSGDPVSKLRSVMANLGYADNGIVKFDKRIMNAGNFDARLVVFALQPW